MYEPHYLDLVYDPDIEEKKKKATSSAPAHVDEESVQVEIV